jgi:signal transduction histidine kinase
MDQTLNAHEPLLVNSVGHSLGAILFALSLYFLLRGRASRISVAAAALAMAWNLSSLLVLLFPQWDALVAISTSALSLLPAILLRLALGPRFPWIVRTGYVLGTAAVVLHALEGVVLGRPSHAEVLQLTTTGFAILTAVTAVALLRSRVVDRALPSRLAAAMSLFLLAVSLAHLGHGESHRPWTLELLVHHASVPLALIVLLQDYRFVLLDAFLRVTASLALAALFIFGARALMPSAWGEPVHRGILLVAACLALVFYAVLRSHLQHALTRVMFGRPDIHRTLENLRASAAGCTDEQSYTRAASAAIAAFLRADLRQPHAAMPPFPGLLQPGLVSSLPAPWRELLDAAGVEVVVPIRLPGGEAKPVLLGHRAGGRRYLSEDLEAAAKLAEEAALQIEAFRQDEMRRLVAQAELRALESQIHPHFLFNALNTLYGVIPRDAAGARKTVLNLADILRYCLHPERQFIPLEEELRIVEAYLEIEKLRLGPRLHTRVEVAHEALPHPIPVLTLQPLVENAVKHGIASGAEGGEVRVLIGRQGEVISIRVEDTGPGFQPPPENVQPRRQGVGLQNVRRRLELCYGGRSELRIHSSPAGSTVEFKVPCTEAVRA